MRFWIVNPFDQLPNETDVPLRYWTLCRMLAEQGHEVTWWSSDFSHLTKTRRLPCPPTDGFQVRLVPTPAYRQHVGIARLRNHRAFALGFYRAAMASRKADERPPPDRIVVSLPPLGVAEQAFKIRDYLAQTEASRSSSDPPNHESQHSVRPPAESGPCQVIVDIMDAWPEVFYQIIPHQLRQCLGPLLLAPLHHSARQAYLGADKISGVGKTYLDLAGRYMNVSGETKPLHLCYHGTDLSRFEADRISRTRLATPPPIVVYVGSMGPGYDLRPLIELAAKWQNEGRFPAQIHLAGSGPQESELKSLTRKLGLAANDPDELNGERPPRLRFHGQLPKAALDNLLRQAAIGVVANRPGSWVACPYKAADYAASGCALLSCLGGELDARLEEFKAGAAYREGDVDSLDAAFEPMITDPAHLLRVQKNARRLAEQWFDRERSYHDWIGFLTSR